MLSKIWLINVVLALFVTFFGFKAYGVWVQGNNGIDIPHMAGKPAQGIPKPAEVSHKRNIPPESTYDVLMTLNLFAPERSEVLPETAKGDEKSRRPNVVEQKNIQQYFRNLTLYGLVITNDSAEALVSHPVAKSALEGRKTTIPRNARRNIRRLTAKQTQWVKVGNTLGDFKVVSIKPDRVLLKAGDQTYDLLLYDKEKLKKREPAKPKTGPNVVGVSVKPKTGSQVPGVIQKTKVVSQTGESSAKPPVLNAKGKSNIPLPIKKRALNAAVPTTR